MTDVLCQSYPRNVKKSGPLPDDHDPWPSDGLESKGARVRRRITPEAGHGLEKLGHAADYLTDEFVRDGCRFEEDRARLHAIELLASLNRQIYLSCGIEPTVRERVHAMLRRWWRQSSLRN
jgi:hypothetical protein